jgi:hypothetical protein
VRIAGARNILFRPETAKQKGNGKLSMRDHHLLLLLQAKAAADSVLEMKEAVTSPPAASGMLINYITCPNRTGATAGDEGVLLFQRWRDPVFAVLFVLGFLAIIGLGINGWSKTKEKIDAKRVELQQKIDKYDEGAQMLDFPSSDEIFEELLLKVLRPRSFIVFIFIARNNPNLLSFVDFCSCIA